MMSLSITLRLIVVISYSYIATSWLRSATIRHSIGTALSSPSRITLTQPHHSALVSSSTTTRTATHMAASADSNASDNSNKISTTVKPTLSDNSLWRLRLLFQKPGFREQEALFRVRFLSTRGYEPPQGRVFIQDDFNGVARADERGLAGSWTLSEDKDDRKDGLWICKCFVLYWYIYDPHTIARFLMKTNCHFDVLGGLFEEPKYPYLYFSLGT